MKTYRVSAKSVGSIVRHFNLNLFLAFGKSNFTLLKNKYQLRSLSGRTLRLFVDKSAKIP